MHSAMRASDQTLNRLSVLKAIRRNGPISRSELPRLTGLSGGTITQLTADLVDRGLVSEQRDDSRRVGRPPVRLEIDAGGGVVIGAGLIGQVGYLTTTFVDLAGEELFVTELPLGPASTLEEFGGTIAEALEEALAASPFDRAAISRVGLALPAVLDSQRGVVHFMTTFPPGPIPLAQQISDRTGLPLTIENALSSMARAEHWFGRARKLDTFTLVNVSHAVNSAEYVDGLPKSGANGLNSELGHVKLEAGPEARLCYCGGKGCLSAYSSTYGILQQTELIGEITIPHLDQIGEAFESVLDRAADYLGLAIANHITASDPGHVLVALTSDRFLERIEPRVRAALARNTLPGVLEATEVVLIVADPGWWHNGTAALALEQTYLGSVPQA
jgi:predicted NBD/HSP70 family sugar kinase